MQAEAATATTERASVLSALHKASEATGADFNYLLGTAMRELSLKPSAKAATSSASGLFQFTDQTWLAMIKTHGAKYGLGSYAGAISQGADGRYHAKSSDRAAILALRNDPQIASLMEGEYAQATRAQLKGDLGRDVCGGELYAAHFLGPDAACRLIRMNDSQPNANAARAFPAAASANHSVFYHSDGSPKTVREVYDWALRQPNGAASLGGSAPARLAHATAPVFVDNTVPGSTDTDGLLASLTSWRPSHHGFFSKNTDENGNPPSSPLQLDSGVMDVLSSTVN